MLIKVFFWWGNVRVVCCNWTKGRVFLGYSCFVLQQRAKKVVCYRASKLYSLLAWYASVVFWGIQITEELWNQSAHQNIFGASWNDVWASKCLLQLAWMASCKDDFLCTLSTARFHSANLTSKIVFMMRLCG